MVAQSNRTILGYVASGLVVGILLVIQNALNYPRPFDLIVFGIYNLFVVFHLLTVVSNPSGYSSIFL